MRGRDLVLGSLLALAALAPAREIAAQSTCGQGQGVTPYSLSTVCIPKLTFHVSGQCLSSCGEVVQDFTSPDVIAYGDCHILGKCTPTFEAQNVFNATTREFYSLAYNVGTVTCSHQGDPARAGVTCGCNGCSAGPGGGNNNTTPGEDPLLVSIRDTEYRLSSFAGGVKFDLDSDGEPERTAWTAAGSDDAFVVLDRNFNGIIDNGLEIFGDITPQMPSAEPNGFRALAVFDDPISGGNGDGKIDSEDSIFSSLLLWTDANHNGRSESGELQSLEGVVAAIRLDYRRSASRDEHGNELRYWATIERPEGAEGGAIVAWNVFFAAKPPARR